MFEPFNLHSNAMKQAPLITPLTEEEAEVQRGSAVPTVTWLVSAGAGIKVAR